MISRSLVSKLYAKYWNFMLHDFPMEKCPIFYQVPKAFCSSKNVQIPSPSLPDRGQTLSITCPTCSQYSISSFRELPVMCKVHKCTAQTFCLEIPHSSFKAQQTWQSWWRSFGIHLYSSNSDFLVVPIHTHF